MRITMFIEVSGIVGLEQVGLENLLVQFFVLTAIIQTQLVNNEKLHLVFIDCHVVASMGN